MFSPILTSFDKIIHNAIQTIKENMLDLRFLYSTNLNRSHTLRSTSLFFRMASDNIIETINYQGVKSSAFMES